jgi:hypothetical protein
MRLGFDRVCAATCTVFRPCGFLRSGRQMNFPLMASSTYRAALHWYSGHARSSACSPAPIPQSAPVSTAH